jgi:hypothetical protein
VGVGLGGEALGVAHDQIAVLEVEHREVATIGVRQALEEALAVEADQRTDDALVDRPGLPQPVEDRVRVGVEGPAPGGVDRTGQIEQLPQPRRVEAQLRRAHEEPRSSTTTGMRRVVRFVYSS